MLTTNFWRKYFKVLIRMGAFAFREHGVRRRAFRMHGLCVFNSFKRSYGCPEKIQNCQILAQELGGPR